LGIKSGFSDREFKYLRHRKMNSNFESELARLKKKFDAEVYPKIKPFVPAARGILKYFFTPQNFYHLIVGLATIVVGIWTYQNFVSGREPNAHLLMDATATVKTNIPTLGDRRLVFLDIFLNNIGKRRIDAIRVSTNELAYCDSGESLKYSCGVQIRKILTSMIQTNQDVDWFNYTNLLECPPGLAPEIDLLGECEMADGTPDFWIEPSDQCHLGHTVVLDKGDYLLKVHLIGKNPSDDFWSRIVYLQVY
jgi:hypothetical protein